MRTVKVVLSRAPQPVAKVGEAKAGEGAEEVATGPASTAGGKTVTKETISLVVLL